MDRTTQRFLNERKEHQAFIDEIIAEITKATAMPVVDTLQIRAAGTIKQQNMNKLKGIGKR